MKPGVVFGHRVRRLRGPLTQLELAARARMQRSALAKIELGLREPTLSTILRLARALRVTPGQLFEEARRARRPRRRRKT